MTINDILTIIPTTITTVTKSFTQLSSHRVKKNLEEGPSVASNESPSDPQDRLLTIGLSSRETIKHPAQHSSPLTRKNNRSNQRQPFRFKARRLRDKEENVAARHVTQGGGNPSPRIGMTGQGCS